jgi:hypothetical protein
MENERKKLVKAGVMARRIGVTVRWLKAEADTGRLPCVKAENRYLFNPEAVINILTKRAKGAR